MVNADVVSAIWKSGPTWLSHGNNSSFCDDGIDNIILQVADGQSNNLASFILRDRNSSRPNVW